jgi:Trypsin-like peptidase domain
LHKDLNMALMRATFKLEQRQDDGVSTVGTGWLVRLPGPVYGSGKDRVAMVTAGHVFDRMRKADVMVHWRREDDGGRWHREPKPLQIRDPIEGPRWVRHPERDIAVIMVNAPDQPRAHAIDFDLLADDEDLQAFDVRPGDEMLALGYPRGLSANEIGFPILRAGRVASYPLWPSKDFPTFLMDFAVFAGNSGGPVYMSDRSRKRVGSTDFHEAQFVSGMLAQQVVLTDERLEIGIVLHSSFVRQALEVLMAKDKAWIAAVA